LVTKDKIYFQGLQKYTKIGGFGLKINHLATLAVIGTSTIKLKQGTA
jgi:hypothetical protein